MQWILQRVVGLAGVGELLYSDYNSESDVSSLKAAAPVEGESSSTFKIISQERSYSYDPSFPSENGILDWIPEAGQPTPKQSALLDSGHRAPPIYNFTSKLGVTGDSPNHFTPLS